jgi:2'-5' RNA ligase
VSLRLFIAAALPDRVREQIERVVAPLRSKMPSASWTRPEAFHLTFAFLGEQNQDLVAPLCRGLESALSSLQPVSVIASNSGFFPSEARARVVWIALQPEEPLKRIAAAVRAALRASKVDFDDKPYLPHLTLARIRDRWSAANIERFRAALSGFATEAAAVDSVILYQSRLSPRGAIHTALQRVLLGGVAVS